MKVLIVEDHQATSDNLARLCSEEFGCEVCQATDLMDAKTALAQGPYELIIWDFNLPDGNTLSMIKDARPKFPAAIMIASSSDMQKRQSQVQAGCNLEAGPFSISEVVREELLKLTKK